MTTDETLSPVERLRLLLWTATSGLAEAVADKRVTVTIKGPAPAAFTVVRAIRSDIELTGIHHIRRLSSDGSMPHVQIDVTCTVIRRRP
jgi:hypothetical protein